MACPICNKPVEAKYRPFCSRRCADIDLGRWLNEGYRIESTASDEDIDVAEQNPNVPRPS